MASSIWIGWLGPLEFTSTGSGIIFPGQLLGPAANNTAAPPYSFTGDTDTGYASSAANTLALVAGGTTRLSISSTSVTSTVPIAIASDTGTLSFGASSDLILARDAANTLALRNSTTAQRLNVYNTYTSASNNELFSVDWQTTANVLMLGTRTAATGTGRPLRVGAQFSSGADAYASMTFDRVTPFVRIDPVTTAALANTNITSAGTWLQIAAGSTSTTTSGTQIGVAIVPTYNQASGNAANTDLLINRTQTLVGSGAQLLCDMQVSGSPRHTIDTTGALAVGGANGQAFNAFQSLTELTTIAASPTTDTTILMPANSIVLSVNVRTTVSIPTATTYTVGDSGSAARFSTAAVSVTAPSTDPGTKAGAYYNASALAVRITPNGTPANNSGRVRVTIVYMTVTPPTS